jgi:anti-sigma regulatory factor (Ser/Thr protein kinase)
MTSGDPNQVFTIVIGNTVAEMQSVVDLAENFGLHHSLPRRIVNDLNVCLDELICNTISYGYDDQEKHDIAVGLAFDGEVVRAEIRDDGRPFDPRQAAPADLDQKVRASQVGGLGLHFVKSLMDEISYTRLGQHNVVKIGKRVRAQD